MHLNFILIKFVIFYQAFKINMFQKNSYFQNHNFKNYNELQIFL